VLTFAITVYTGVGGFDEFVEVQESKWILNQFRN